MVQSEKFEHPDQPLRPDEILRNFIDLRMSYLGRNLGPWDSPPTAGRLFRTHTASVVLHQAYDRAREFCLLARRPEEIQEMRDWLTEKIFDDIVIEVFLPRQYYQHGVLLPQDMTFDFAHALYPWAKVEELSFGRRRIQDVVGKALLAENKEDGSSHILAVYDVTIGKNSGRLKRHYLRFKDNKRRFPKMFGDARFVYITTQEVDSQRDVLEEDDVDFQTMPLGKREVKQCVNYMIYEYVPTKGDITLFGIQKRAIEEQFPRKIKD